MNVLLYLLLAVLIVLALGLSWLVRVLIHRNETLECELEDSRNQTMHDIRMIWDMQDVIDRKDRELGNAHRCIEMVLHD